MFRIIDAPCRCFTRTHTIGWCLYLRCKSSEKWTSVGLFFFFFFCSSSIISTLRMKVPKTSRVKRIYLLICKWIIPTTTKRPQNVEAFIRRMCDFKCSFLLTAISFSLFQVGMKMSLREMWRIHRREVMPDFVFVQVRVVVIGGGIAEIDGKWFAVILSSELRHLLTCLDSAEKINTTHVITTLKRLLASS